MNGATGEATRSRATGCRCRARADRSRSRTRGRSTSACRRPTEEYTRGFRSTAGIVSPDGVYLAGDGAWYPRAGDDLVEFELTVHQPAGWLVVSEGNGTARDATGAARWSSHGPTDEIHLVGGPLELTRQSAGAVETEVYLRQPDPALAAKYLGATAQYLEMYRGLIGPYPYGKFALVENFWETGYGMPSFTLLGLADHPLSRSSSRPRIRTRSCTTGGATRCSSTTTPATGAKASPPTWPIT